MTPAMLPSGLTLPTPTPSGTTIHGSIVERAGARILDRRYRDHQCAGRSDHAAGGLLGFRFGVLGVYVSGWTREKVSAATGQDAPGAIEKLVKAVVKKK
jgi:hypothetical protein